MASEQPGNVMIEGQQLTCPVCAGTTFSSRESLLNTRGLTLFNIDWANKAATNYICGRCGYIYWFLR
jgi:ribosomal protein S27AE